MLFPSCKAVAFRCGVLGLSMFMLVGCEDASLQDTAELTDNEIEVSPKAGDSNVALVSSVKVRFASDVAVAGDSSELKVLLDGKEVDGVVTYSERQHQLTFQPREALKPDTRYTVQMADVLAYDGAVVPAQQWAFNTTGAVGMTAQWVLDSCMSSDDIALLAAINNERESGVGCSGLPVSPAPALSWHCDLAGVAYEHSADLARMGVVGDVSSSGKGVVERVSEAGVVWRGVAENTLVTEGEGALVAMDAALSNFTQCENLLNPALTHIGVASAPSLAGAEHQFWVQLLVQQ